MEIDGQPYAEAMDCILIEQARKKADLICNPIFDWTFNDVWDFIHDRGIAYNPLYDPPYNYTRVGCIGCPLATHKDRMKEFADFPQYKQLYINAFDRMLKEHEFTYKERYKDGEAVFRWWIEDKNCEGQLSLEDVFNEDGTLKEEK